MCSPKSPHSRLVLAALLAAMLSSPVFGVGALALATASTAAASERDVAAASDALVAAKSSRVSAERRQAELSAELVALDADIATRFAGAADLAAELETARTAMRHSAVTAFINGGNVDASIGLLTGADPTEMSQRRAFSSSRTLDWADAASRFEALKRDNDPNLVVLTERRSALAGRVADATDAVLQAGAVEADAERAARAAALREAEVLAQRAEAERLAAVQARQVRQATRAATPAAAPARPAALPGPSVAASPGAPAPPSSRAITVLTDLSAPLPEPPAFGPSEDAWAQVRRCESGGNYQAVSGSGRYRGAYQFDMQTWSAMGGRGDPAAALPMEQDARAKLLFAQRGARAWPQCGVALN